MITAVILHGKPSKERYYSPEFPSTSNYYWLPWLQKQLAINGIPANTPEVPNAWNAHYPTWVGAFEHYPVTSETILIGHSCGAGFLVRWLSEHPEIQANKVVLVAPWIDPGRQDTTDFFDFTIDPDLLRRTAGLTIINSDDDEISIQESVKLLREEIAGINYIEFHRYRHFYDDRRMEFPELLEEILR